MKFLIDNPSILNYPEIVFDKDKSNKYLITDKTYTARTYVGGISRTIVKADGIDLFRKINEYSLLEVIGNSYNFNYYRPNEREINESILNYANNEFIVISDNTILCELLESKGIKSITPKLHLKNIKVDTELLNLISKEIESNHRQNYKEEVIVKTIVAAILVLFFIVSSHQKEFLGLLTLLEIIPIVIIASFALLIIKKKMLLFYSLLELVLGLAICIFIYNFSNKKDYDGMKSLLSLISGVFVFLRGLTNVDDYIFKKNKPKNKFYSLWKQVFMPSELK